MYKTFQEHRPADQLHEHSSFYLSVKQNPTNKIWFKRQPMGQNYLGKIMKDMCNGAGIPGRKTNHSIRKTMCTTLLHAGVNPNLIAQLSGHKHVASINNYAIASKNQQRQMSNILQNPKTCLPLSASEPRQPPKHAYLYRHLSHCKLYKVLTCQTLFSGQLHNIHCLCLLSHPM